MFRKNFKNQSGAKSQTKPKTEIFRFKIRLSREQFPFFTQYWEPLLFLLYVLTLLALVLPGLRFGFDVGHDSALLMSSYRIWHGQIPFRDFFPWYGPLYHYFLSLFVALMGKNLYAVKFFIDVISPILSMGILLLSLRKFNLPVSSRLLVLIVTPVLGLERIYYCGSLRNFLPILLIAFWDQALRKRQKHIYFSIIPAGGLLFFFSPEVGIYTLITALAFIALALIKLSSWEDRKELLSWSGAGLVVSLGIFGILLRSTTWCKNYLEYVSVLSENLCWSHGLSRPSLLKTPQAFIYYLQPLIHLFAIVILLGNWLKKRALPENWLLSVILTIIGLLLYNRTLIKAHPTHVQFGFLPALIILSLSWTPPLLRTSAWKRTAQILGILIIIYGGIFFRQKMLPEFHGSKYQTVLGVRVSLEEGKVFQIIQEFYQAISGSEEIIFPVKSLYYAYLGLIPELPFDDLHYLFYPRYWNLFLTAMEQKQAKYLILNEKDIFWDYPGENVDLLLDYIDANYELLKFAPPVRIYKRRQSPVETARVIKREPETIVLNKKNGFQFQLKAPAKFKPNWIYDLEFTAQFHYPSSVLEKFSMPIVECWFDGKKWNFKRPEYGRQRINPRPGKHRFRAYLLVPFQELKVQITFPGALNPAPSTIIIENIQWREFLFPNLTPRSSSYILSE